MFTTVALGWSSVGMFECSQRFYDIPKRQHVENVENVIGDTKRLVFLYGTFVGGILTGHA